MCAVVRARQEQELRVAPVAAAETADGQGGRIVELPFDVRRRVAPRDAEESGAADNELDIPVGVEVARGDDVERRVDVELDREQRARRGGPALVIGGQGADQLVADENLGSRVARDVGDVHLSGIWRGESPPLGFRTRVERADGAVGAAVRLGRLYANDLCNTVAVDVAGRDRPAEA